MIDIGRRYDEAEFVVGDTTVRRHTRDIGGNSYRFICITVKGASAPSIIVSRVILETVHRL